MADVMPPSVTEDARAPRVLTRTADSRRSWITLAVILAIVVASTTALFLPLVPEATGGAACLLMLALIFLRMPVAFAMLIPSLLGMYALRGSLLVESQLATLPYLQVASWSLSVIPMFILMGLLLWRAGLTESLYDAGRRWLGWMPGGLAVGTNLAGAGLASVSGSSVGTTYALARIGIPEMLKAGYDKRLAIGSVVVAGLPGQLIPPSIMLVIYAGIAQVPIGPQLLAGVGPGLLVAAMFTVMIVVFSLRWARRGPEVAEPVRYSIGDRFWSLARVWPIPIIVVIVVYGVFSGVFTATEAGAVAAAVSMIVAVVWRFRSGPWRAVVDASMAAIGSVGAIFLMLIGVEALSRMFALTGLSGHFAELIVTLDLSRVEFLLMMTVVYIVLGTFMEPLTMMMLTVPILLPTLAQLDISLLWYGVFAVFMAELAVVTPPVGILSFVIHSICREPEVNRGEDISLGDVFGAVWWFLPMALVVTLVLIFFPEIVTALPELAGGGG